MYGYFLFADFYYAACAALLGGLRGFSLKNMKNIKYGIVTKMA